MLMAWGGGAALRHVRRHPQHGQVRLPVRWLVGLVVLLPLSLLPPLLQSHSLLISQHPVTAHCLAVHLAAVCRQGLRLPLLALPPGVLTLMACRQVLLARLVCCVMYSAKQHDHRLATEAVC
jgi:hypothetical protein